jgi:Protein of unknown function (DUF2384)
MSAHVVPLPLIPPAPPALDPTRFLPANREKLSAPGLRAFLGIAGLWGLTEQERLLVLGLPARSTYHAWVRAAKGGGRITLPVDTLLRISAVLGIHKALRILFATDAEAVAWLRGPHAALPFAGQAPLALVIGGTQDGLMAVRRFLDAARGGLFMPPNAADAPPLADADIVFA